MVALSSLPSDGARAALIALALFGLAAAGCHASDDGATPLDGATRPGDAGADGPSLDADAAPPGRDGAGVDAEGTPDADPSIDADRTADGARTSDASGTADGAVEDAAASCALCASYGAPVESGRVTSSSLNALSGIAVSKRNAGVVYVHNDHDRPEFFALSEAGALLGTFTLSGATVDDLEDIAVGPCPAGSCVYLADIGGNIAPRTQFALFRVPEPEVRAGSPSGASAVTAERLSFTYADGASHNAESILVDPRSDTLYVITKVAAGMPSTVYRLPATFGGAAATAQKVVDLPVPRGGDQPATSASAHPCMPAFLLRTNNTLYEFRAAAGGKLEDAFSATPAVVPAAQEPQGEGVAYRPDGRGYFTTSEGAQPALHRVGCP